MVATTAGGLAAACGGTTTQQTNGSPLTGPQQTVRVGDTVAIDNPEIVSEKHFGDRLAALTNNHYQVRTFPNSVLGTAPAMNEQVRNGTLEMTKSNVASLTGFDKRLAVLDLAAGRQVPDRIPFAHRVAVRASTRRLRD